MVPFYAYQHVCGGYMSILPVIKQDLQRNSRNGMNKTEESNKVIGVHASLSQIGH